MADLDPRLRPLSPLSKQDFDLAGIDIIVNTHLHFDHCGGNHLFAGRPIYVQRRELDDARSEDDYTVREWVEAPGVRHVPVDGELELLPGLRLVPDSNRLSLLTIFRPICHWLPTVATALLHECSTRVVQEGNMLRAELDPLRC